MEEGLCSPLEAKNLLIRAMRYKMPKGKKMIRRTIIAGCNPFFSGWVTSIITLLFRRFFFAISPIFKNIYEFILSQNRDEKNEEARLNQRPLMKKCLMGISMLKVKK